MADFTSSLTASISRQYDLFQNSLETLDKDQKFLNFGYTVDSGETYEERQQQLCLKVFEAANIGKRDLVIDVGFGSGEQDFLLSRTREFDRLVGFNISERQVRFANARAANEHLTHKLSFYLGEAEILPEVANSSADKLLAIECAFYFDRPRFYRRVAEVLKPAGWMILADISLSDRLAFLTQKREDLRRMGSRSLNRALWEEYFITRSVTSINMQTLPGAQWTVWQILKAVPFSRLSSAERNEWMKMAFYSQLVALGLAVNLIHYDLIVLERKIH